MRELVLDATIENIEQATAFMDAFLEEIDCPMRAQMQLDVMMDELFSNIAPYAYAPEIGKATVRLEQLQNPAGVSITFLDSGKPYNPLEKEDPDVTLSAEERDIGGLGIFMVKKTMDSVTYQYEDDKNVLTVLKNF